jgi:hypothetical protein
MLLMPLLLLPLLLLPLLLQVVIQTGGWWCLQADRILGSAALNPHLSSTTCQALQC